MDVCLTVSLAQCDRDLLREAVALLRVVAKREALIMKELDDLETELQGETEAVVAVEQVVQNLVNTVQTELDQIKQQGVDTARVQAVLDTARANGTRLAALAMTNVPGVPAPTVPPPAPPEPPPSA